MDLAGNAGRDARRQPRPWWSRRRILITLGWLFLLECPRGVAAEITRELQIKAGLLRQLIFHVEWPRTAFPADNAPLLVGILGSDPFGEFLEKLLDQKAGGRPIRVVRFDSVEKLGDCHFLYVNLPEPKEVQRALDLLRTKPVLTVSDREGFTEQGGIINLLKYRNHLKPHINNAAARRVGLTINSLLLTVAEITNP